MGGSFYSAQEVFGHHGVEHLRLLPLFCLSAYVFGFSIGIGSLSSILLGEMIPLSLRNTVCGVGTAFNWFCSFIVATSFTPMSVSLGDSGVFYMYSSICFICCFLYFFMPEKKVEVYKIPKSISFPKTPL